MFNIPAIAGILLAQIKISLELINNYLYDSKNMRIDLVVNYKYCIFTAITTTLC
jgi:hypothetical protein